LNAFDTFLEALLLTYVFVMHSQTAVQTCYFLTPRLHHDAGSEIAIGKHRSHHCDAEPKLHCDAGSQDFIGKQQKSMQADNNPMLNQEH